MVFGKVCFWYYASTVLPPDVTWCEAASCSLIVRPYNTWSNLALIFVGLFLLTYSMRKSNKLEFFSTSIVIMGLFSFVYHASFNFVSQMFDFLGMLLFTNYLLFLNLKRKGWPVNRLHFSSLVFGLLLLVLFFYFVGIPMQIVIVGVAMAIIATEISLDDKAEYSYYWVSMSLLAIGLLSAIVLELFCKPHSIWQGVAVWHVLAAISFIPLYKFYEQFNFS